MFQRILVPVDFSERTRPAVAVALELAKSSKAHVDLLHVWEPPRFVSPHVRIQIPGETRETLRNYIQSQAVAQMAELVESLEVPEGVVIEPVVECGRPAPVVLEACQRQGNDLIVVATSGRSGLSRVLIGSVAENLVRNAPCPVLTIRVGDEETVDLGEAEAPIS